MRRPRFPVLLLPLAACAALLAWSPAPAAAQTLADYDYDNLTFRGVGLGGGYMWSDRIENTEHWTLRLDLGYLGPGIRMVPSLTYWDSEIELEELDQLATRIGQQTGVPVQGVDLSPVRWSDISLDIDAHLVWSVPFGILTFIGTGAGLHALNGRGPAVDDTFVEDLLDDVTLGINGIAGFEFEPINRVRIFAEGRYTAMSSLRYATARGGAQIMFSQGNVAVGAVPPPPDPDAGRRAP